MSSSVYRNINKEVKDRDSPLVWITVIDSIKTSSSAIFLNDCMINLCSYVVKGVVLVQSLHGEINYIHFCGDNALMKE